MRSNDRKRTENFQGKIRRWLGFWVTADLARDLKHLARQRGQPLSEILRAELAGLFEQARQTRDCDAQSG